MLISKSKAQILEKNGFKYNFYRMIYFNKKTKKIFSYEAIDDNDDTWLKKSIKEPNKEKWQFYWSLQSPSNDIKNQIISELES